MGVTPTNVSFGRRFKNKLFGWFRLQSGPTLRLYEGFGNGTEYNVYGHALSLAPLDRKKYRNSVYYNMAALLRLFMVKPVKRANITVQWKDQQMDVLTADDGFFSCHWKASEIILPGRYPVKAMWKQSAGEKLLLAEAESNITIPSPSNFAVISDIDDTFLISHSGNLRKRLYVLFTHNPRSRRPFDGVVKHYQLLYARHRLFFYVSSSEWNLYSYIREFIRTQQLPPGILLLNQLKTFSKVFATGQGKHRGKFTRIVKIIEAYPKQKFVLLGDDSQQDPAIYASVVENFRDNIIAVYIRKLQEKDKPLVIEKKEFIESQGIPFCYFYHSDEAIRHSVENGLAIKT